MRALIIGTKTATKDAYSGANRRLQDIADYLKQLGFQVEYSGIQKTYSQYDLICLVSYATARNLRVARKYSRVLWFDATDSWLLTQKSLGFKRNLKGWLRIMRDWYFLKQIKLSDFVTFCSDRDAALHKKEHSKTYIFAHTQPKWKPLKNLGHRFVFVGPANYEPNKNGVSFLSEVYSKHPEILTPLYIFGSGYQKSIDPRITTVSSAEDEEIYGSKDIHLVPITSGAGVKYKVIFPTAFGLPTISTVEGANGLLKNARHLHVAPSLSRFEELVVLLSSRVTDQELVDYSILEHDDRKVISKLITNS